VVAQVSESKSRLSTLFWSPCGTFTHSHTVEYIFVPCCKSNLLQLFPYPIQIQVRRDWLLLFFPLVG